MSDNVHAGHRERLKTKFRQHGLESFTDIEALELLLFYAIPRANTNELAHALLKQFRNFRGVMEADINALQSVPGIGENAAALLHLVTELNRRYQSSASTQGVRVGDSLEAGKFLQPLYEYQNEECSILLCLDSKNTVIDWHFLAKGTPNMVGLSAREIADIVLRDKASRVILSHNHLSGIALPSEADIDTTEKLSRMLRMLGVELSDHLIFSGGDYVSLRDSEMLHCI